VTTAVFPRSEINSASFGSTMLPSFF